MFNVMALPIKRPVGGYSPWAVAGQIAPVRAIDSKRYGVPIRRWNPTTPSQFAENIRARRAILSSWDGSQLGGVFDSVAEWFKAVTPEIAKAAQTIVPAVLQYKTQLKQPSPVMPGKPGVLPTPPQQTFMTQVEPYLPYIIAVGGVGILALVMLKKRR